MGKLDRVSMSLRPSLQSLRSFISGHIDRMIALWSPYNNPEAAGEHISVFRLMKKLEAKTRVFVDPRWLKPLVDQMHKSMVYIRDANDQSEFAMLIETLREKAQKATDWKPTYATIVHGDPASWETRLLATLPSAAVCKKKIADLFSAKMIVKERLSLIDSFSQGRISVPVRGGQCSHIQVFDLRTYLNRWFRAQEKEGAWHCEHCEKLALPSSLVVDAFILQILGEIGPNERDVFLTENGWMTTTKSKPSKKRVKNTQTSSASAFSSQVLRSCDVNAVDLDTDDEPDRADTGDSSPSSVQSNSPDQPASTSSSATVSTGLVSLSNKRAAASSSCRVPTSSSASIDLTTSPAAQPIPFAHSSSRSTRAISCAAQPDKSPRSRPNIGSSCASTASSAKKPTEAVASSSAQHRRPTAAVSPARVSPSRSDRGMNSVSSRDQANRALQTTKRKRLEQGGLNGVPIRRSKKLGLAASNSQKPETVSSNHVPGNSWSQKRRRLHRMSDSRRKNGKKRAVTDSQNGASDQTPSDKALVKPKRRARESDSRGTVCDGAQHSSDDDLYTRTKKRKKLRALSGVRPHQGSSARPQNVPSKSTSESGTLKKRKKPKKRIRRFVEEPTDGTTDDDDDLDYDDAAGSRLNTRKLKQRKRREAESTDDELWGIRRNPSRRGRAPPERLTCTEDGMQTTKMPDDGNESDAPVAQALRKQKKPAHVIDDVIDFRDPRRAPVMMSETGEPFYEVERLVKRRRNAANTGYEFLVKWDGYTHSENTWEPQDNLRDNCGHLMDSWPQSANVSD